MFFSKNKLIKRVLKGFSVLVLMVNVSHLYAKDAAIAFETELSMEEVYQSNSMLDDATTFPFIQIDRPAK